MIASCLHLCCSLAARQGRGECCDCELSGAPPLTLQRRGLLGAPMKAQIDVTPRCNIIIIIYV